MSTEMNVTLNHLTPQSDRLTLTNKFPWRRPTITSINMRETASVVQGSSPAPQQGNLYVSIS